MIANYHTHTKRCGHAGQAEDEEYVRIAIKNGFKVLGFSDHCPLVFDNGYEQPEQRMYLSELDEYIDSINRLKEKYKDEIRIHIGLECEYFPQYKNQLKSLHDKVEYLIVGAHWLVSPETGADTTALIETPTEMQEYGRVSVEAIESGYFVYLNHPEHGFSNYPEFDEACKTTCYEICNAAKKMNVPLEYNLYGIEKRCRGLFNGLGYPYPEFWKIAAEVGCKCIIGCDAHGPHLLDVPDRIESSEKFLKSLGIEVLETLPGLE